MAQKYLDYDGLLYFWQKLKNYFVTDVTYNSSSKKIQKTKAGTTSDVVTLATVATSGSYTDLSNTPTIPAGVEPTTTTPIMDGTATVGTETKFARGDHVHPTDTSRVPTSRTVNGHALSSNVTITASDIGVESGAEVNQNAFSNVKVGSTTISADTKTDTLELVAGTNITLTPDATNDKVTIATTAEQNVNADWDATSGDAQILNKPTIPPDNVFVAIYGETSWEDIQTAILAKKAVLCFYQATKRLYYLTNYTVGGSLQTRFAVFNDVSWGGGNNSPSVNYVACSYSNGWETGQTASMALLDSPTFTGTPTAPTASAGTNTTQIATTAFVTSAVQTAITGAVAYQGIAPTTFAPTNYSAGWYWIVGTAGTYVGQVCEAGDMIFCKTAGTTYSASDFDVVQTNLDITAITNAEIDTIMAS